MEELIKISKEVGFESQMVDEYDLQGNKKFEYYWMCELQKWLRDEKGIIIQLIPESFNCWFLTVLSPDIMSPYFVSHESHDYNTYEKALQHGLLEACKLIK